MPFFCGSNSDSELRGLPDREACLTDPEFVPSVFVGLQAERFDVELPRTFGVSRRDPTESTLLRSR